MPEQGQNASSLKSRIRNGETVICVSLPMDTDRGELESIVERGPYDLVWVDSQHRAFNEEKLVSFCAMAAELDFHVMLRMKHTRHAYLTGNMLDLGLSGVEVPQVESESTVDEAASSFYYPQVGTRSWGGPARRGFQVGIDRREYAQWWNDYGMLWMQIESVEAVTIARKLAKPGVDCLSFGPMDLQFSLESHPDHPLKTVDDCVRYVVKQLEGTGVAVCARGVTPDTRQKYIDMGVSVLMETAS